MFTASDKSINNPISRQAKMIFNEVANAVIYILMA